MQDKPCTPGQIAIVGHPSLPETQVEASKIAASLEAQGVSAAVYGSIYDDHLRARVIGADVDLLIAVGGDGTMLRASHLCAAVKVPILGVNLGRFGFLTEIKPEEWQQYLPRLLQHDYRIEARMMLQVNLCRQDKVLTSWDVLNEVVVSRGQYVRPIQIHAAVDGYSLATYVADGLIASTPTGSTAYALAVGGPIMPPELRNIMVIPVAPHLSVDRALILPEGAHVTITAYTNHQAVISADGQSPVLLADGDTVKVEAGCCQALFVRFHDAGCFYQNLIRHMEQNPSTGSLNERNHSA